MPVVGPLLWRLLPWGLLAVAALVGWALWNQLGMAKLKLANAQEVIRVREDDARRSAQAVARLSDALTRIEAKVITVTETIYAAPITRNCGDSPSIRASRVGVRELITPGGQAPAGREPPAALQRPGAGAGERQRQRHRGRAGPGGEGLRHLPGEAQRADWLD
jgi:hypothetical protein